MSLPWVGTFLQWAIAAWLALIFLLVLVRMATGSITLVGLLRMDRKSPFGLERLQLVFVTLLFAAGYAVAALTQGSDKALPGIPTPLLLVLLGSQGTYLAVKASALFGGGARRGS
jgi:hypothetical protein